MDRVLLGSQSHRRKDKSGVLYELSEGEVVRVWAQCYGFDAMGAITGREARALAFVVHKVAKVD